MYRELLDQYRDIDNKIIICLENDNEELLKLFDDKEEIIKSIVELSEYKDDIKKEFDAMGLDKLDDKIKNLISSNMIDIKNKIRNNQRAQKAFTTYSSAQRGTSLYSKIL